MGFDVNFNNNKPIIKGAQAAQDGGAGNLGYFEQEEGKKNKKKDDEKNLFEDEQEDQFIRHDKKNSEDEEEDLSLSKIIAQIILDIKDWFKKLFKAN